MSPPWIATCRPPACRPGRLRSNAPSACCRTPSWRMPTQPPGTSGKRQVKRPRGRSPPQMGLPMLRGEIRLTDLDPARLSEANKRRPAVIVSNDRANASAAKRGRGVVTIVPVTSNVARVYPFQVLLNAQETGLRVDSKAQGEQ